MKNYYGVDFSEQREKLLNSKTAKAMVDSVIEKAEKTFEKTYESLKISEYMMFLETGDRKTFQQKYFERRNDCSYVSIAYWLTEDDKYKKQLADLIFNICDEYTWCVPAHACLPENPTSEQVIETIDLFQAETARLLADISVMVGQKMPYYVNDRIQYEIRRRVIAPLRKHEYHWQQPTCVTNWASVCSGGVLAAVLAFGTKEEIQEILPKLYSAIEHFLMGYHDDGCCMEGCHYWNYGFDYFVIFARMILEYTGGEVDYFKREKVKNIATFIQKVRMGQTKMVSFSDSTDTFSFSPGLACCLKEIYPDAFVLPPLKFGTRQGTIYAMKELLWFHTDYSEEEYKSEFTYFEDAQWYLKKYDKYSFAAKAGNNDEPHNHNDIGSFMIVTNDDEIPLTDLGAGVYTAFTFDNRYRYTILQHASFGHSVPIINGTYQKLGSEYFAKAVTATDSSFSFDMSGAYDAGIIKSLHRDFQLFDDKMILRDTVEYSDRTESFTERMVSVIRPEIHDNYVDLKSARIQYDSKLYRVSVSQDRYNRHSDGEEIQVYLIDFEAINPQQNTFEFHILIP